MPWGWWFVLCASLPAALVVRAIALCHKSCMTFHARQENPRSSPVLPRYCSIPVRSCQVGRGKWRRWHLNSQSLISTIYSRLYAIRRSGSQLGRSRQHWPARIQSPVEALSALCSKYRCFGLLRTRLAPGTVGTNLDRYLLRPWSRRSWLGRGNRDGHHPLMVTSRDSQDQVNPPSAGHRRPRVKKSR